MSLGQENYGLYGVIGGMTVFIGLLNNLLSVALSRYYAVAVGAANVAEDKGDALQNCRRWFSSAILIHSVFPIMLLLFGLPIGEFAIQNGWVEVPVERLGHCLWVFRSACVACFVGMVLVPYTAMYAAKQCIAELSIYSFVTTAASTCFYYYMVMHPADWLVPYAAWTAAMMVLPNLIVALRARCVFPECRLVLGEMFSLDRFRDLLAFAGWQAFGGLGNALRMQGTAILLNRHVEFGCMRNSSMSVANQVAAQADMLSGAMLGAFQPAIANAYGAGDYSRVHKLAFCCCKIGTLMSMLFALPLALELPTVLALWLDEPPVYAVGLCWSILAVHVIDRTSSGHMLAVTAAGKISAYQAFLGSALMLALPLACLFVWLRLGVYSVGWALIISTVICAWGRVWFARSLVGMSAKLWLKRTLAPLMILAVIEILIGCVPRCFMGPSFSRVVATTLVCESVLIVCTWIFLLDSDERVYLSARLTRLLRR